MRRETVSRGQVAIAFDRQCIERCRGRLTSRTRPLGKTGKGHAVIIRSLLQLFPGLYGFLSSSKITQIGSLTGVVFHFCRLLKTSVDGVDTCTDCKPLLGDISLDISLTDTAQQLPTRKTGLCTGSSHPLSLVVTTSLRAKDIKVLTNREEVVDSIIALSHLVATDGELGEADIVDAFRHLLLPLHLQSGTGHGRISLFRPLEHLLQRETFLRVSHHRRHQ